MDLSTFEDRFTIRSYEVDKNATVTLPQIANYFQEAAGKHAINWSSISLTFRKKGSPGFCTGCISKSISFPGDGKMLPYKPGHHPVMEFVLSGIMNFEILKETE